MSRINKNYIVRAKNLTKRFGDFTAVNQINFEVEPGEIFGFLGANGAGKTTAMRMLTGLLKATDGDAHVAGHSINGSPEKVKYSIGYMSQKFSLYDDLKVYENIRLYGGIYGLTGKQIRSKIEDILEELNMTALRNKLVRDLPLGWKQKLAFSVALVHDPAVVFLDEPTSGVDPITRRSFWELIYRAARRGVTVFVTTHYLDEAEYCDRVSIMVNGVIEALDTPQKLKEKYHARSMHEVFVHLARKEQ